MVTASRITSPTCVALRLSSSRRSAPKLDHMRCLLPPYRSTHLRVQAAALCLAPCRRA